MPFRIGTWELGIILFVTLFFFGAGKLPQVGSALGKSIRAVRNGLSGKFDTEENGESEQRDAGIKG